MKGFITFISLAALAVAGYLIFNKAEKAPVMEDASLGANDSMASSETSALANLDGKADFDVNKSEATWIGTKTLIKDYVDRGTINIKSGQATFAKGTLTGGEVVFDMNSIATLETGLGNEGDKTSGQAKHMKSADFFDTTKYPEARFVTTSVAKDTSSKYTVSGDLTIKDKTNPVSFPVTVENVSGVNLISGSVTLDRTLWDIRFGSGKFFPNLGDKVINDNFTLEFKAVLK